MYTHNSSVCYILERPHADTYQREFELNYDHLDQRHGSPAMAGAM
jgi:hypothetical protein